MNRTHSLTSPRLKGHRELDRVYIWWAHGLALAGGFNLGAHIAWYVGMHRNLPGDFPIWIQAHGHLQLLGWTGLYIMGVSLYFLPRLSGVPLPSGRGVALRAHFMGLGLTLETLVRFFLPHLPAGWPYRLGYGVVLFGALLQAAGVGGYLRDLARTWYWKQRQRTAAVRQVSPYLGTMAAMLGIYTGIHLVLVAGLRRETAFLLDPEWHRWTVEGFLYLVLFPVAYAFTIRNFPLYLRLYPVPATARTWGMVYATAATLAWLAHTPLILRHWTGSGSMAIDILPLVRDGIMLAMVLALRWWRRVPMPAWAVESGRYRRDYPDAGEFGRFERLLYSAYLWLGVALVLDLGQRIPVLMDRNALYGDDPVRHAYLMGFITLLIMGMAQRMLPGFMHKKRLAHPRLVTWTFLTGNLAAVFRVVPLCIPAAWYMAHPRVYRWAFIAFGQSGWLAMIAVGLLAWNLGKTAKLGASDEPDPNSVGPTGRPGS